MIEPKYLLVLANSAREGKHCVAGKLVTPLGNEQYRIEPTWIRLTNPRDPLEGAVPDADTRCRPGRASVQPLDLIKVRLFCKCHNADHPEDWYYDPAQPWQYIETVPTCCLDQIAETPPGLWHEHGDNRAVRAGYVRSMGAAAATLYLIKAPLPWTFTYWREDSQQSPAPRTWRRLQFNYAGKRHDFSVTDVMFNARHKVFKQMQTNHPQTLPVPNPGGAFFCLSLTKLRPQFNRKHYKICATIFET